MKALVTGGAGFIGSQLTNKLLELGHEVFVMDDLSNGSLDNIPNLPEENFYHRSIITPCESIFSIEKFDTVFHLAALPRVQFSIAYPIDSNTANIHGTLNILDTARRHGVKRFVYSSSSSAYGDQPTLPLKEDMKPNPLSPYALQKLTGEQYAVMYNDIHGIETVSLRYFNVYGPTQKADSAYAAAIPKFTQQALKGQKITIFGDGSQTRDFTMVDDVVNANIQAATIKAEEYGKVVNVGCGNQTSVNQIVDKIEEILGIELKREHLPPVVESKHTRADISVLKEYLQYVPKVSFDEGIKITVEGIKEKFDF